MAEPATPAPTSDKPAILQDEKFIVEEGFAYRAARTGAIWLNKLFFSSLVLLGIWLLYGGTTGNVGCVEKSTGTQCNVFLTPTAAYLGAMAIASFLASILFGLLGLVVGKRILQAAKADEEIGAGTKPAK